MSRSPVWKREAAIAIIRLMVLQAQAYNLPDMPKHVKFDSSLIKSKRRT